MIKKIINHTKELIQKTGRKIINKAYRKRLINKEFSLISSNCTGGLILHDLNLKFLSPTINLFFFAEDFIKFVEKLEYYIKQEIVFADEKDYDYPIGFLDDVKIHFMHYENKEEAKTTWEKRRSRINYDNLFIMMTDRDGCTENIIDRFNKLPYKNKVIFTNKKYEQYPAAFHIKGFENDSNVGQLNEFSNSFGKKYYDQFDYVKWFNNEKGGVRK